MSVPIELLWKYWEHVILIEQCFWLGEEAYKFTRLEYNIISWYDYCHGTALFSRSVHCGGIKCG